MTKDLLLKTDLSTKIKNHFGLDKDLAFSLYQFFYQNEAGSKALALLKERYLNQAVINMNDKEINITCAMREGQRKMILEIIFFCDEVKKIITELNSGDN